MQVLVFLIPAALLLGGLGLAAFLWALRRNQFEDMEGAAQRILFEEDRPLPPRHPLPERTDGKENQKDSSILSGTRSR